MSNYPAPFKQNTYNPQDFPSSNGTVIKNSYLNPIPQKSLGDLPQYSLVNMKASNYVARDGDNKKIQYRPEGATCSTDKIYLTATTVAFGLLAGNFIYLPDSPFLIQLSSSSTVDNINLGTGAVQVLIQGYNSNFDTVIDVFLMNGQTPTLGLFGTQFFRISVMVVLATGVGFRDPNRINAGYLYATVAGDPVALGVPTNNKRILNCMHPDYGIAYNGCGVIKGTTVSGGITYPPEGYIPKQGSVSVNYTSGTAADIFISFMIRNGMSNSNSWFQGARFSVNSNGWLGDIFSDMFSNSNLNIASGGSDYMIIVNRTGGTSSNLDAIELTFLGQGVAYRYMP